MRIWPACHCLIKKVKKVYPFHLLVVFLRRRRRLLFIYFLFFILSVWVSRVFPLSFLLSIVYWKPSSPSSQIHLVDFPQNPISVHPHLTDSLIFPYSIQPLPVCSSSFNSPLRTPVLCFPNKIWR